MNTKTLAQGRWQEFSFAQQMGNIGSEINRTINWYQKKDKEYMEESLWQALELIDLTLSDKRWQNRLFEIFRLKEVICDFFLGDNQYNASTESFKNYFLFFALRSVNE